MGKTKENIGTRIYVGIILVICCAAIVFSYRIPENISTGIGLLLLVSYLLYNIFDSKKKGNTSKNDDTNESNNKKENKVRYENRRKFNLVDAVDSKKIRNIVRKEKSSKIDDMIDKFYFEENPSKGNLISEMESTIKNVLDMGKKSGKVKPDEYNNSMRDLKNWSKEMKDQEGVSGWF